MHGRTLDLTGQQFGSWLAMWPVVKKVDGYHWAVQCVCSRVAVVRAARLRYGGSKSCGCIGDQKCSDRLKTHGESQRPNRPASPEYIAYMNAKRRCTALPGHKDYEHYSGRGIEFRFASFPEFLAELGRKPTPGHSIDRIDNSRHYERGNIRWATAKEQSNNRRPRLADQRT